MIDISKKVLEKISVRSITASDVWQCFYNRVDPVLVDDRTEHKTVPESLWFISETDAGRTLKIVYMKDGESTQLKSAFEPSIKTQAYYRKRIKGVI